MAKRVKSDATTVGDLHTHAAAIPGGMRMDVRAVDGKAPTLTIEALDGTSLTVVIRAGVATYSDSTVSLEGDRFGSVKASAESEAVFAIVPITHPRVFGG